MTKSYDHPLPSGDRLAQPQQDNKSQAPLLSAADFLSPAEQVKYGLQVKQVGGEFQAYYHADGKDNVVATAKIGQPGGDAAAAVDRQLKSEMAAVERKYQVTFAKAGEDVEPQATREKNCTYTRGEMVHTKLPTFADVFAVRGALAHSLPSQLTPHDPRGMKVYFLDRRLDTQPVYGNKWTLAMYTTDKDSRPAMYITPDGEKLPTTERDLQSGQVRYLTYTIEHELTHNSQKNQWSTYPVADVNVSNAIGWTPISMLPSYKLDTRGAQYAMRGRSGEYYVHVAAQCGADTLWYEIQNKQWLTPGGKHSDDIKHAVVLTNDRVGAAAEVKPTSYYFPEPLEMSAEGLSKFRTSAANRRELLAESPRLYRAVEQYDNEELARFYGKGTDGKSYYVRMPGGYLHVRSAESEAALKKFERGAGPAPQDIPKPQTVRVADVSP